MRRKRRNVRDVIKSVLPRVTSMVERPTEHSEGEPSVRDQLTYARVVIDDMLLDLDVGDVKEQDAQFLLRTVEDIYAQVSGVEAIETEDVSRARRQNAHSQQRGRANVKDKETEMDDEPETYVHYSGLGGREVRAIGKPVTHAEDAAETLAENRTLVRVRPFYKVPSGRGSLTTARSPFAFEGVVVGVLAGSMVTVRMQVFQDCAPWPVEGTFDVCELHKAHYCECAACKGENGIAEKDGA